MSQHVLGCFDPMGVVWLRTKINYQQTAFANKIILPEKRKTAVQQALDVSFEV